MVSSKLSISKLSTSSVWLIRNAAHNPNNHSHDSRGPATGKAGGKHFAAYAANQKAHVTETSNQKHFLIQKNDILPLACPESVFKARVTSKVISSDALLPAPPANAMLADETQVLFPELVSIPPATDALLPVPVIPSGKSLVTA